MSENLQLQQTTTKKVTSMTPHQHKEKKNTKNPEWILNLTFGTHHIRANSHNWTQRNTYSHELWSGWGRDFPGFFFFFSFPDSSLVWISRILGWFTLLFGPGESRGAETAAAGIWGSWFDAFNDSNQKTKLMEQIGCFVESCSNLLAWRLLMSVLENIHPLTGIKEKNQKKGKPN